MEAKELRIGNKVGHPDWYKHGKLAIFEVKGINGKYLEISNGLMSTTQDIKDLVPVRLSQKWLNKCGFKKSNGFYELDLDHDLTLMQGDKEGCLDVYELNHDSLRVQYLHELQNLVFTLSKTELKIDL